MRTAEAVLALACVVVLGACRKSAAPEASPSGAPPAADAAAQAPADAPPAEAPPAAGAAPAGVPGAFSAPTPRTGQMAIIAVRLGPAPGEGPGTFEGGVFRPGAEVTASVDASVLPPSAIVKVSWFDANGTSLGEEHKPASGTHWLTFTAPGSSGWARGSYRVEFLVSTGGFASESFIVGDVSERPTLEPG